MICVRAGPGDPWFRDGIGTLPSSESILLLLLLLQVFISGLVTFPKKGIIWSQRDLRRVPPHPG